MTPLPASRESIRVRREDLERALAAAGVPADRLDRLWKALGERPRVERGEPSELNAPNAFFYVGAMFVILGLVYFGGIAWESYGAGGMLTISLLYGVGFAVAARALIRRAWQTPGGLSATAAVAMVPLIVYSFEKATGLWPDEEPGVFSEYHELIRSGWVAMELATIAAAVIALRLVRFSFLSAPLAFSAWYLSMDASPLLFGENVTGGERASFSIAVGLAMIAVTFTLAERRGLRKHAFWGYFFGLAAYFGGTAYHGFETSDLLWWLTGVSGVVCLLLAVLLERRVFAAFGGLAIFSFVGYLSSETFANAAGLPFVLSAIGIAIVAFGMVYQRRREQWRAALLAALPKALADSLPRVGDDRS